MVEIQFVRTREQAIAARDLAFEFVDWVRDRYPEMQTEIDTYLVHQKFEEQVKDIRSHYTPPRGECLLAVLHKRPVGLLMMKDIGDATCEMNRMFVRPEARGLGVGRALVSQLLECGREMGFARMVLGALPRHHEALSLYQAMGFRRDARPRDPGAAEGAIQMVRDLTRA